MDKWIRSSLPLNYMYVKNYMYMKNYMKNWKMPVYKDEQFLEFVGREWISTPEIAEPVGCTLREAHIRLSMLEEKGVVVSKGKGTKLWKLKKASSLDMKYELLRKSLQNIYSSKMFNMITKTWNPVTGCKHACRYCWARRMAETKLKSSRRYRNGFSPRLNREDFREKMPHDNVFVTDMGDLFGAFIPDEWIEEVLEHISKYRQAQFFFLTKNPQRYHDFIDKFPDNAILGATIETDSLKDYSNISSAPPPEERIKAMKSLDWDHKLLSIEPILRFSESFPEKIMSIDPGMIYVGYDNYHHHLPEPKLEDTLKLIKKLNSREFAVLKKSLRRAWDEW